MKEATGEANITVITIVLIAIVLAVGTVIVNSVLSNTGRSSACNSSGYVWVGGQCCPSKTDDGKCSGTPVSCQKAASDAYASRGIKKGDWYCKTW